MLKHTFIFLILGAFILVCDELFLLSFKIYQSISQSDNNWYSIFEDFLTICDSHGNNPTLWDIRKTKKQTMISMQSSIVKWRLECGSQSSGSYLGFPVLLCTCHLIVRLPVVSSINNGELIPTSELSTMLYDIKAFKWIRIYVSKDTNIEMETNMSWKITGYSSKHLLDIIRKIQKVSIECMWSGWICFWVELGLKKLVSNNR